MRTRRKAPMAIPAIPPGGRAVDVVGELEDVDVDVEEFCGLGG